MAGVKVPPDQKRSRTVGIRMTAEQYDWIAQQAKRQTKELGFKVTMSAVATGLLMQAMRRAQG